MDRMIEEQARRCGKCAITGPDPVKVPLHQWEEPEKVWQRVHIDFCGPTNGNMWFILVDAKSKWPEAIKMGKTTTLTTIRTLQKIFRTFGIPEQIVSDNGPQFISSEFANFCDASKIKHIRTAPYHPQSNGEAERFLQTFKKALEKNSKERSTEEAVDLLLLNYRFMPHAATGKSPAEVMFGRNIRTKFTMTGELNILGYRDQMDAQFNKKTRTRFFHPGDPVWVRSFHVGDDKWIPGVVIQMVGNVMCEVQTFNGTEKRHFNQLKFRVPPEEPIFFTVTPDERENSQRRQTEYAQRHESTPNPPQRRLHTPPEPPARRILPPRTRRPPNRYSPSPIRRRRQVCVINRTTKSRLSENAHDSTHTDTATAFRDEPRLEESIKGCTEVARGVSPTEMPRTRSRSRSRTRSPRRSKSPRRNRSKSPRRKDTKGSSDPKDRRQAPDVGRRGNDRSRLFAQIQALENRVRLLERHRPTQPVMPWAPWPMMIPAQQQQMPSPSQQQQMPIPAQQNQFPQPPSPPKDCAAAPPAQHQPHLPGPFVPTPRSPTTNQHTQRLPAQRSSLRTALPRRPRPRRTRRPVPTRRPNRWTSTLPRGLTGPRRRNHTRNEVSLDLFPPRRKI